MKRTFAIVASILFVVLLSCNAAEDEPWYKRISASAKPEILTGSDEDVVAPALSYELGFRKDKSINDNWTKTLIDYGFSTEGTVATDNRANSEGLFAEIHGGVKRTLSIYGKTGSAEVEDTRVNTGVFTEDMTEQIDLPFFHLSAVGRFETDQIFENYSINYGPRLGVIQTRQDELSLWVLMPKLQLDFHRVDILQSRDLEEQGIDEDSFWRLGGEADWRLEVGSWWISTNSLWNGLGVHARVSHYRGFELPAGAEQADYDESWLYSGGVHFRFKDSKVGLGKLRMHFAYVTVSNGRTPPATRDQTSVKVGLAFTWNEGVYY